MEATVETPLLSKSHGGHVESSNKIHTSLNLIKMAIGTGILTLPYGFLHGGVVAGVVLLVIVAAANYIAIQWLLECYARVSGHAKACTTTSYSAVSLQAGGSLGMYSVELAIVITCLGGAVTYLISIENTMYDVSPVLSKAEWVIVSVLPLLLMVLLDSLAFLSWVSAAAIGALMVGFASVIGYGLMHEPFSITGDNLLVPSGLSQLLCLVVFSYGYPCVFFPVYDQMKKKNDGEFLALLIFALVVCVVLFSVLGTVAMGCFNVVGVEPIIINNLPKTSVYAKIVRCALSLVLLLSYPVSFYQLNQMFGRYSQQLVSGAAAKKIVDYMARVGALLASAVLAIIFPSLPDVVAVLGAFSINYLTFVFPSFAYLRICGASLGPVQRLAVYAYLLVSIVVMAYTVYDSTATLLRHRVQPF